VSCYVLADAEAGLAAVNTYNWMKVASLTYRRILLYQTSIETRRCDVLNKG
jgi:hypothetical protein